MLRISKVPLLCAIPVFNAVSWIKAAAAADAPATIEQMLLVTVYHFASEKPCSIAFIIR